MSLPTATLVGRPNVGKSTIFNALTRSRDAIVADLEGLTRDRRYGVAEIEEQRFVLVDTGGLTGEVDGIGALTDAQVQAAIAESDVLVLVVDGRAGLTAEDQRIAEELRRLSRPVVVAVNKTDGLDEAIVSAEFYGLGFDTLVPTAASHRRGLGNLAEALLEWLPAPAAEEDDEDSGIRLAVLGRPNVGKSTLINRLLGEDRVVAYDMPGTTRDTIEVPWEADGQRFTLIDTAGVRRRSRVDEAVEKFSVIKALQAIESAHVVAVMLDASEGVVEQDLTLLGHVLEAGKALLIVVNKWDGLDGEARAEVKRQLDRRLAFVPYAETVFISARHGSGLGEFMDAVLEAYESSRQELSSGRVTEIVRAAFEAHQPPMVQGRTAKLRYAHLGGHDPLTIVIHGNRVNTVPESYKRYLANTLRDKLKLVGTPLLLQFRGGSNPYEGRKNPLTKRQLAKRRRLMKHVTKGKKRRK